MDRVKKILILIPNTRWFGKRYFHITAYTPCLLASILDGHAEVEILDTNLENLDDASVQARISAIAPDMVGITCGSVEYAKSAHKAAELVKNVSPDILTVMGGIYPTLLPHLPMNSSAVDYVIIGEGEARFPELVNRINRDGSFHRDFDGIGFREKGEVVIIPKESYVENLDRVPFPDYSKIDASVYFNTVNKASMTNLPKHFPFADTISSRGCPFRCCFCSSRAINGKKIRYRSAENVLKEIDWLHEEYGVRHITFNDDNFFLDKKRAVGIMKGLIERDYGLSWKTVNAAVYALDDEVLELMKASGAYFISLAIESGSQDVLKNIIRKPLDLKKVESVAKKCKELGFQTSGIFMIGLPGETWDQIRQTFRYAEELDLDCSMFGIATPLPCTEMYDIAKSKGYLTQNDDVENLEFFGFGRGVIKTDEFDPFELQVLRAFEWDRINFTSEEKKQRACEMFGITLEELDKLRKETRRKLGVHNLFQDELYSPEKTG